jgi:hypothetical protein
MDSAAMNGGLSLESVIAEPWRIGENGPCLECAIGNRMLAGTVSPSRPWAVGMI